MTNDEIYAKILTIYSSDKGKKYINHLIRSYTPFTNGILLTKKTDLKTKCAITNSIVVSKEDLIDAYKKLDSNDVIDILKVDIKDRENPIFKHIPAGSTLGVKSVSSDAILSRDAHIQLLNFFSNNLLLHDANMVWLSKQIKPKKNPFNSSPKKKKPVQKKIKFATHDLSENSDLIALRNKFKKDGN